MLVYLVMETCPIAPESYIVLSIYRDRDEAEAHVKSLQKQHPEYNYSWAPWKVHE